MGEILDNPGPPPPPEWGFQPEPRGIRRVPAPDTFTVIDETRSVRVIHPRHGKQLTWPGDFPADLEGLENLEDRVRD